MSSATDTHSSDTRPALKLGRVLWIVSILSVALLVISRSSRPAAAKGDIELSSSEIIESSGLARSTRDDDILWTHNDSGDKARLFAFDRQGKVRAELVVKKAEAHDWEDMCSFERDGKHYLAVGDIGDNPLMRKHVTIYVFEEPKLRSDGKSDDKKSDFLRLDEKVLCEIQVKYPQGPTNCEALAYDPLTQSFLLATKENFQSNIYRVPIALDEKKSEVEAIKLGSLNLPLVTGAAISDDGAMLAIATYGPPCIVRRLNNATSVSKETNVAEWNLKDASATQFFEAPPRRQGESICFEKDGRSVLLTSEGSPMPLYIVPIPSKKD